MHYRQSYGSLMFHLRSHALFVFTAHRKMSQMPLKNWVQATELQHGYFM